MPKFIDLTGKRFGRLVVISRSENSSTGKIKWNCLCDCGNKSTPQGGVLKSGKAKSCGCFGEEARRKATKTHGLSSTSEYTVWYQMIERCENEKHVHYKSYGGRGIKVCDRWKSFVNFYADMGKRHFDSYQLDRINNDDGYSKENCHWTTIRENCRNKRGTLKINLKGKIISIAEAAEIIGLQYQTLRWRVNHGWNQETGLFKLT